MWAATNQLLGHRWLKAGFQYAQLAQKSEALEASFVSLRGPCSKLKKFDAPTKKVQRRYLDPFLQILKRFLGLSGLKMGSFLLVATHYGPPHYAKTMSQSKQSTLSCPAALSPPDQLRPTVRTWSIEMTSSNIPPLLKITPGHPQAPHAGGDRRSLVPCATACENSRRTAKQA